MQRLCVSRVHMRVATWAAKTAASTPTPLVSSIHNSGAFSCQRRHVHERPFLELPQDLSKGEAYEMARDALLQLNVMTRRGIEPDVLTYTSLISTMGRAGLEWQAYKLFSRMIEQGVRPLPETYVALRDATGISRVKLREHIQTKIEETMDIFPEQLAEAELARQREEDRLCVAKFEEYLRGDLPPLPAPTATAQQRQTASSEGEEAASSDSHLQAQPAAATPVATMRIRHPTDVWNTSQWAEEMRDNTDRAAQGEAAEDLSTTLGKLHEEELRIFLAVQRQLRHGDKAKLIDRIVRHVSERAIRAMLDRRRHYFRSVESLLAADMRVVRMTAGEEGAGAVGNGVSKPTRPREQDRTLTASEKESSAPEVIHAPWGLLRKPMRRQAAPPPGRSEERLERVRLSPEELLLVRHRTESGELDELPEGLLRRYAFQFSLRWRRSVPLSLLEAVQWHATMFLAPEPGEGGSEGLGVEKSSPTPSIRLKKEQEGMQETLENFEAFRVISQRTNNLQVVDNKEINLHLKRVRRDALQRERKTEDALLRESNILAAASLAASAKSYTPPPFEMVEETHVLGLSPDPVGGAEGREARIEDEALQGLLGDYDGKDSALLNGEEEALEGEEVSAAASDKEHQEGEVASELPPWALSGGEEEFNLSTGRFGSPEMGRYRELSDSKFRVLPSREAQSKWSVDAHLLPSSLQDIVQEAELDQERRHEAVEREYERRLQFNRYRKWDGFLRKAQEKKKHREQFLENGEEGEEERVRPLPAKKRLAQILRRGSDKEKVSEAMREKFNKGL